MFIKLSKLSHHNNSKSRNQIGDCFLYAQSTMTVIAWQAEIQHKNKLPTYKAASSYKYKCTMCHCVNVS